MSEVRGAVDRIKSIIHDRTWDLAVDKKDIITVLQYAEDQLAQRDTLILVGDYVKIDDEESDVHGKVGKFVGETGYPLERAIVDFGDGDVRSCDFYVLEKERNG